MNKNTRPSILAFNKEPLHRMNNRFETIDSNELDGTHGGGDNDKKTYRCFLSSLFFDA